MDENNNSELALINRVQGLLIVLQNTEWCVEKQVETLEAMTEVSSPRSFRREEYGSVVQSLNILLHKHYMALEMFIDEMTELRKKMLYGPQNDVNKVDEEKG